MPSYTLSHLQDHDVQKGLLAAVPIERTATAAVLAHIAEFDARQLYREQSCSSMFVYCVRELGYSEDGASKRIHAARAARQFPALFEAVADGRLHLSGVCLLAPKLTGENVYELVAAAAGRSKAEIEYLLAVRYPKPGTWAAVLTESASSQEKEHAPGHVGRDVELEASCDSLPAGVDGDLGALLAATSPAAAASAPHRRDRLTPISADAWALEATLDQETCDMLRRIQALRGRGASPHDLAGVLKRAFRLLEDDLLLRKLGAGTGRCRGSKNPWHITPVVMRLCWKRDDARCTFVGENGKRCDETHDLQFDHILPPSRGGDGSLGNVRLRCRAHNLHAAEKLYGREFVKNKRDEAKGRRAAARAEREAARARVNEQRESQRVERERQRAAAHAERTARNAEREQQRAADESAHAAREAERRAAAKRHEAERAERERHRAQERQQREARCAEREATRHAERERRAAEAAARAKAEELVPALRSLGCSREQALAAAAHAAHIPDAPLGQRVLAAVRSLGPRGARKVRPEAA